MDACMNEAQEYRDLTNIIYGVEDIPPWGITLGQAVQHVALMSGNLVFPLIIARAMDASASATASLLAMTMLAGGIGTIFQALRKPFGSGYLCPEGGSEPYIPAGIAAVQAGGLGLFFGMTILAGLFQAFLSRFINRLRFFFPPEVSGVVIIMVGFSIIPFAVSEFFGVDESSSMGDPRMIMVGLITLGSMLGINIWGKGLLREFSFLIGLAIGYIAYGFLIGYGPAEISKLTEASFAALPPLEWHGLAFDPGMLLAFLVAALCASLKAVGDITTCQKINDPGWKRPDLEQIGQGVLAEGAKTVFGALVGGMAHSTSSSNVGLSMASGVTSRRVAYTTGLLFASLAFFPKLAALFVIMPKPVDGAALLFCICFMVVAGLQVVMSRMLDARKTFMIGLSLALGLSVDMMPGFYDNVAPFWLQPMFGSSLTFATITVVLLNLVFRLGIAMSENLAFDPAADDYDKLLAFMQRQGGAWGARPAVINRAASAIIEFLELAAEQKLASGTFDIQVRFDEFNLDVLIQYTGQRIELPREKPSLEDIWEDSASFDQLSAYMVRKLSDRARTGEKNGLSFLELHYQH